MMLGAYKQHRASLDMLVEEWIQDQATCRGPTVEEKRSFLALIRSLLSTSTTQQLTFLLIYVCSVVVVVVVVVVLIANSYVID